MKMNDASNDTVLDPKTMVYPDCLIIESPELKKMHLILGESILTVFFWGCWFYLWLPLISLALWMLGFHFFYHHMVQLGGLGGFVKHLKILVSGISVFSGSLAIWSLYNFKRYGSYNRRTSILLTNDAKLVSFFVIPQQIIHKIRLSKRTVFHFNENNSIRKVDLSVRKKSADFSQRS